MLRGGKYLLNEYFLLIEIVGGSVPCVVVSTAESTWTLVRANDEYLNSSRPKMLTTEILDEVKTVATTPRPGELWHNLRRFSPNELISTKRVAVYEVSRKGELSNMMQEAPNRGEAISLK